MDEVQKKAVKDLLHLLVDKEETALVMDLLSKLPAPYASMAQAIAPALMPIAVAAEDKVVDAI